MSGTPRSEPPELPNFRHVSYLGGGGFADVFLYDQLRPARQVALKVLRNPAVDARAQRAFDDEADLMASVSTHPYIVSVYGAEIAPDGRPFLVMEYYPRPHFGLRSRQGPMDVAEVLQVGVRLASAVETAHRAGILHRDIKPANILVSQYGRPGLTDFGIAGSSAPGEGSESQGFSAAYAPREIVLDEHPGDVRSDVYSLAATLYTLLAGRSPFEIRGGDNAVNALMHRVVSSPLPTIERDDLPLSFELLLEQALAKDPSQRPPSAEDLGRSLQRVETEMGHAPTEFELADDTSSAAARYRPAPVDDDDEGTRASKVQVVRQDTRDTDTTTDRAGAVSGVPTPIDSVTADRIPRSSTVEDQPAEVSGPTETVARRRGGQPPPQPVADPPAEEPPDAERAQPPWALIGSAVVIVIVLAAIGLMSGGGDGSDDASSTSTSATVDDAALVIPDTPPVPTDVAVTVAGETATVTWEPGDGAEDDDTYVIVRTDSGDAEPTVVEESPAEVAVEPGASPCFEVSAQRESRVSVEATRRGCAE